MSDYPVTNYEKNLGLYRLVGGLRRFSPESEVVLDEASGIVTIISKDHPLFNILRGNEARETGIKWQP